MADVDAYSVCLLLHDSVYIYVGHATTIRISRLVPMFSVEICAPAILVSPQVTLLLFLSNIGFLSDCSKFHAYKFIGNSFAYGHEITEFGIWIKGKSNIANLSIACLRLAFFGSKILSCY